MRLQQAPQGLWQAQIALAETGPPCDAPLNARQAPAELELVTACLQSVAQLAAVQAAADGKAEQATVPPAGEGYQQSVTQGPAPGLAPGPAHLSRSFTLLALRLEAA